MSTNYYNYLTRQLEPLPNNSYVVKTEKYTIISFNFGALLIQLYYDKDNNLVRQKYEDDETVKTYTVQNDDVITKVKTYSDINLEILIEQYTLVNGISSGKHYQWYDNGMRKKEYELYNHNYTGYVYEWYENGNPMSETYYINGFVTNSNYVNYTWYQNGQMASLTSYNAQNKLDGLLMQWEEDGEIFDQRIYKDGKLIQTVI